MQHSLKKAGMFGKKTGLKKVGMFGKKTSFKKAGMFGEVLRKLVCLVRKIV
jgi:hypothetical protein